MFLWLGTVGCAAATSIAGWANVFLLWIGLGRAGYMKLAPGFTGRVIRLFLAAVIMGGIVWTLAHYGQGLLMSEGRFVKRFSGMAVLVSIGLFAYLAAVVGCGSTRSMN
jgi:putative peptidoglycan lipid II flippase